MCAGCRRRRPKPELVRLAVSATGAVILDLPCRAPGRGAYLCRESGPGCLEKARRRHGLGRSLRVGENVIDLEALSAQLQALAKEGSSFPAR
jgi:predicted RNA-binding protein YlxR (DUF448 family)